MKQIKSQKMYFLKQYGIIKLTLIFVLISFIFSPAYCKSSEIKSIKRYRQLRFEKLNQPRPVIHNNDGCDAYVYPVNPEFSQEFSIPNFLNIRSAGLKGTDVSTISYCSISSSFGQFTHNTKAGEFITLTHQRTDGRNVVPEFVKLGTDPLEVTCKFAHDNGFEFFWSNRINDVHDFGHRPEKPYERWSKLKQNHPEYLFGRIGEKLPFGRWSAVDFSNQEIRNLCVQYYTEVCENYDVDGIELDFLRHLHLFGNVARGGVATAEQLEMLTDMLVRIRTMTEKVGMKKGKPILVLVRIPDSSGYCKGVGIDIETWMAKGLLDLVVGSDYFRLNPWRYLVELGHKYGVKVYAGLSEPRVKAEHPLLVRFQNPVFRARCAAAWQAGVDGLYIFNEYNTRSQYLSEIGNAIKLKSKDKLYFATYLYKDPKTYLKDGGNYFTLPLLLPSYPIGIGSELAIFSLEIGDERVPAKIALILYVQKSDQEAIKTEFNGFPLTLMKSTEDGLCVYEVSSGIIRQGENILRVSCGQNQKSLKLLDAAILFHRNPDDRDTEKLVSICFRK